VRLRELGEKVQQDPGERNSGKRSRLGKTAPDFFSWEWKRGLSLWGKEAEKSGVRRSKRFRGRVKMEATSPIREE